MKLLLLAENWPPRIGGIEAYLSGLAAHVADATIDVIVPADGFVAAAETALLHAPAKHVSVIRRRFYVPWLRPKWWLLWRFIRRRAQQEGYDAVLCGKALFEGHIGYRLKKQLGIPFIVFTYAMEIETWRARPRARRQLARVLRSADRVAYINERTKRTLHGLGVQENQLLSLLPALPRAALTPVPQERAASVRKKYEISQRYVLSVGRLIPRKGFDTLLSAFADLDQTKFGDVQLVIVGDGPAYEQLDALAEHEIVATSVHLITDASDDDVAALHAGALAFALTPRELPGDYEGFGIVYLEAAARGVPAIGTRTGGVPEAVIDGETGLLVPPDDVAAVRDALARILSATALRERLGARARERVEREFLWEQRAATFQTVLEKMK